MSSFLFILFFFLCFVSVIPPLYIPAHLFILVPNLFSCCFLLLVYFSFQVLYYSTLFFKSSRSLFSISCILSVYASILFPISWIIFTIITLNSFSGRLPTYTSLIILLGIYSCSFIWDIVICHLILSNFLYCGLHSTDCRNVVPCASGVCPW